MLEIIILILILLLVLACVLCVTMGKSKKKEQFASTLGPWGYEYMPNEWVYPNFEYAYKDGRYAYFFDATGDLWKRPLDDKKCDGGLERVD